MVRQSLCAGWRAETKAGPAFASAASKARHPIRVPGATWTLSSRDIFLRSQGVYPQQPHLWTACRFIPTKARVRPQRAEGVVFLTCWPHAAGAHPVSTLAGPEPAGGLWPRGDHPHQCCWLPDPVSGPSQARDQCWGGAWDSGMTSCPAQSRRWR